MIYRVLEILKLTTDLSIICIAGDLAQNKKGVTSAIFNGLKDIPIRMISYGGSNYNLSFLVKTTDKIAVLNILNRKFVPRTDPGNYLRAEKNKSHQLLLDGFFIV